MRRLGERGGLVLQELQQPNLTGDRVPLELRRIRAQVDPAPGHCCDRVGFNRVRLSPRRHDVRGTGVLREPVERDGSTDMNFLKDLSLVD
jgi:hypothetical protein